MAKILIIDDERSIRSTLREILEYEDYAVEDVDNGIDGLELIRTGGHAEPVFAVERHLAATIGAGHRQGTGQRGDRRGARLAIVAIAGGGDDRVARHLERHPSAPALSRRHRRILRCCQRL